MKRSELRKMTVRERRLAGLRNEAEGIRKYREKLAEYVEENPTDKWGRSQLDGYERRLRDIEQLISELE